MSTPEITHPPNKLTMRVDTREKYPLLFPANILWHLPRHSTISHPHAPKVISLTVEHTALKTGDYQLAEYPDACVVERKGSVRELYSNLLGNPRERARALRAFHRLTECCHYPTLLLDIPLGGFFSHNPRRSSIGRPQELLSELTALVASLGITLLSFGPCKASTARRNLGGAITQYMLNQALMGTHSSC